MIRQTSPRWLAPWQPGRQDPFDRAAAAHLCRRALLFHTPALLDEVCEAGPAAAVRRLTQVRAPGPEERRFLDSLPALLALERPGDLAAFWWMWLQTTENPFLARMGLFWHDHFATGIGKVRSVYWMAQQIRTFHEQGLGSFGRLLSEVARGPAMIRWLDNESNRKGRPNENFARELFELFTLGRGVYREEDIREAARAFTGWRIRGEAFYFDPRLHDGGSKQVLGSRGRFGGAEVLEIAVRHPGCGRFLAGKWLHCFVGPGHPPEAREELARVFRDSGGDVRACLEKLLASKLFFEVRHRMQRIRGPVEWILWLLRSLELRASPRRLHRAASRMGQALLDPPDVAGWDEEEAWISSAGWLQRANLAARLSGAGALRPRLEDRVRAEGAEAELDFLLARLFPAGLPARRREVLLHQARSEALLPRPVRLGGLLRACALLPEAWRF